MRHTIDRKRAMVNRKDTGSLAGWRILGGTLRTRKRTDVGVRGKWLSFEVRQKSDWSSGWSERPGVASLPGGPQNLDGEEANY
jgi:hypothetical protein